VVKYLPQNIFIKTGRKRKDELGKVFHFDLFGKREFKYNFLGENTIKSFQWNLLESIELNFYFVNKNFLGFNEYEKGFKIDKLFEVNNTGIETGRDDFFIDYDFKFLKKKIENVFQNKYDNKLLNEFKITNTTSFKFKDNLIRSFFDEKKIRKILYRPFDLRYTYYDKNLQRRASYNTIKHLIKDNFALSTCRQQSTFDFQHILVTNCIIERCTVSLQTKETGYVFPLYLYSEETGQQTTNQKPQERTPNLDPEIIQQIEKALGLTFVHEKEAEGNVCMANSDEVRDDFKTTFAPIDLLDYIYAVLHSPEYREKYKEFLKIDFPRVPYPQDSEVFWKLVELGGQLRQVHLLESPLVDQRITGYPEDGDNVVSRKITKTSPGYEPISETHGKVWINDQQYFDKVPLIAWEFYIGGYQPAQKWLKDRKERTLEFDDILHYQKIIVALTETDRLMKKIDKVGVVIKDHGIVN